MCMYGYTRMSVVILGFGLRQPQTSSRVRDSRLKVFNAGCRLMVEDLGGRLEKRNPDPMLQSLKP